MLVHRCWVGTGTLCHGRRSLGCRLNQPSLMGRMLRPIALVLGLSTASEREPHGARAVATFDGSFAVDSGTISNRMSATPSQVCDRHKPHLHLLLSKSDAAYYVKARCFVWLGVSMVFIFEDLLVFGAVRERFSLARWTIG